jgi:hypothetical protein
MGNGARRLAGHKSVFYLKTFVFETKTFVFGNGKQAMKQKQTN